MYYSILIVGYATAASERYVARYRRGTSGDWFWYKGGIHRSWEEAYAVLEKHANPAALAVRFVGTF